MDIDEWPLDGNVDNAVMHSIEHTLRKLEEAVQESINKYKACPFCGNENLRGPYLTEYIGDSYMPYWWIECNNCPASMQVDGETDKGLYTAWNKRT